MGLFGKKKKPIDSANTPTSNGDHKHVIGTQRVFPQSGKSVRFAAAVSDDEGGFVTDSEIELNRATRHGSLRVRNEKDPIVAAKSGFIDRTAVSRSQSYDHGRSHSYSERQLSGSGDAWRSNVAAVPTSNYSVDDDYLSDCSTVSSSFSRGGYTRVSLPILKNSSTRIHGLVFLTYMNVTKKVALPAEIRVLDTIKAMFLKAFPQLTNDMLNSPKRRFYILDRSCNKFTLLVHLNEVGDGTMLKLIDSDNLTPGTVRRSRSAHSAVSSDSNYFSEPECDLDSSRSSFNPSRSSNRMVLTKETNIDEPIYKQLNYAVVPSNPSPCTGVSLAQQARGITASSTVSTQKDESVQPIPILLQSSSAQIRPVSQGLQNPPCDTTKAIESVLNEPAQKPEERNRMAKMEAQIANLTALVQTVLSRPGSSASDRLSEVSYDSSRSKVAIDYSEMAKILGISLGSSSTPQPEISAEIREKISSASGQVSELKNELKQLKRIHESLAETMQDTIKDALCKIQNAVKSIPGATQSPLRNQRTTMDASLDAYKTEQSSSAKQISDLEACVSELRADVVSKRCHVNMSEVEALALRLSKSARSAADVKSKFNRISKDFKQVLQSELDSIVEQQQFLNQEPERIEDSLRRCKAITNVLFTLKRLAAIDTHRTAVIPRIHTKPLEDSLKSQLLKEIRGISPNHASRMKSLQSAEQASSRRRDIFSVKENVKLENSLDIASSSLKEAEHLPKADVKDCEIEALIKKARNTEKTYKSNAYEIDAKASLKAKSNQNGSHSSHVQNRDSIHWDVSSDSDDGDSIKIHKDGKMFIDVTEAPTSAFTIVQSQHSSLKAQTLYLQSQSLHDESYYSAQTPPGKVYKVPAITVQAGNNLVKSPKNYELQQQCQKLQQLQRNYRESPSLSSSSSSSLVNANENGSNNTHFVTPTSSRASSTSTLSNKPIVAPKPLIRPGTFNPSFQKGKTELPERTNDDHLKKSDSDSKSTTV